MQFLQRFSRGELRLTRIEAFSDGVFAIIVTLLVLELKVPELQHHGDVSELARQLLALLPKFLSWLISFIIVAKFWLNHHHVLGLARHADYGMVWLNSIFLMFQSFVPFPTALLGEYPDNPLAVSFFGGVMAFNTLVFIVLHHYVSRRLVKPELAHEQDPHLVRSSLLGPASYLLAALLAWVYIPLAFIMVMITPLFYIVPPAPKHYAAPAAVKSESSK
ncbi:MAG: TMEM175 family protein [Anaerolineae bacterium]